MTGKKWLLAFIVAAVALGAIYFVLPKDKSEPTETANTNTTSNNIPNDIPATDVAPNSQTEITAQEVASHDNENDCWTIINDKVYDLTSFIASHPGGDEILRACGTDATTLFTQRETPEGEEVGSGTPHSSTATQNLNQLQIGVLAE